jgi:hypothetical protein
MLERPRASLAFFFLVLSVSGAQLLIGSRLDRPAMERSVVREAGSDKEISEKDLEDQTQRAINLKRLGLVGGALSLLIVLWLSLGMLFWLQLPRGSHSLGFLGSCKVAVAVSLPLGLRALLSLPVIASSTSIDPQQTSGLFRTALGDLFNPPISALAWLDPFWIWCAVLFALAGRVSGWGRIHTWVGGAVLIFLLGFGGRGRF